MSLTITPATISRLAAPTTPDETKVDEYARHLWALIDARGEEYNYWADRRRQILHVHSWTGQDVAREMNEEAQILAILAEGCGLGWYDGDHPLFGVPDLATWRAITTLLANAVRQGKMPEWMLASSGLRPLSEMIDA